MAKEFVVHMHFPKEDQQVLPKCTNAHNCKVLKLGALCRGGRTGCTGCTFVHPIFGPLVSKL